MKKKNPMAVRERSKASPLHPRARREESPSYLCGGLDRSAVLQQQLHHFDAILLARDVKGREAVEGARVRVRLPVQQQLGHSDVAAVS